MRRLIDPTLRLLLGSEPRLRMPLLRTLTAAGIYAFSLLAQWQAVRLGTADLSLVIWITGSTVIGVGGFYILIRSGLTLRFRGVALIMPQMVFAIISLALVYLINPEVRGMLLMIVALVLVFGAFTLSLPRGRVVCGCRVRRHDGACRMAISPALRAPRRSVSFRLRGGGAAHAVLPCR